MDPPRRRLRGLAALLVAWGLTLHDAQAAHCHAAPDARPRLRLLQQAMAEGRFVSYEPTSLEVVGGRVSRADADSIRADLAALRPRFDSLITYESGHGLEALPAIAGSLGYRALLVGVWNPDDAQELQAALRAAREHPKLVLGIVLGNETVYRKVQSLHSLARRMHDVHAQARGLLVATSEPFHLYAGDGADALFDESDVLLPNIHPVYQPWFRAGSGEQQAARFVRNVVDDLRRAYCGPVLVKETGEPTAPEGEGWSEEHQAAFWNALRGTLPPTRDAAFATFSAFDLPWRAQDGGLASEAHWGVFDAQRRAKRAVQQALH
jgi:exo-beta-1,3-glucanase (GH17 family)